MLLSGCIIGTLCWSAEETPRQEIAVPTEPPQSQAGPPQQRTWVDRGHAMAAGSVDTLAEKIDRFFGAERADLESASTALRLILVNDWREEEGNDTDVKLRGKLNLPRISERLSLIFSDEEGQNANVDSDVSAVVSEQESTKVDLQYNIRDKKRSRIDFDVGLRSSLQGKARLRYRYQIPVAERYTHRFTESLAFIDGEGFSLRSRYELDRKLNEKQLLRWANNLKFVEQGDGVEWSTRLLLGEQLDDRAAISWFIWSSGVTRPDYLTTSYGLGLRFRRNFHRDWLFYELEPGYAWIREEVSDNRNGAVLLNLRLIISLERLTD